MLMTRASTYINEHKRAESDHGDQKFHHFVVVC